VLLARHLDDAHAARAEARQLGLVAQGRDLDSVVAADLEDRLTLETLDHAAVDLDADPRCVERALGRGRGDQLLGTGRLERRERVALDRGVRAALRLAVVARVAVALAGAPGNAGAALCRALVGPAHLARGPRDQVGHAVAPAVAAVPRRIGRQTPAGHSPRRRCASSSGRKWRRLLIMGSVASRS